MNENSFLWGAATSPHQVDGELENNDWYVFANSKSIKDRISSITKPSVFYKATTQVFLQPTDNAVKFWDPKYYLKDFDAAKDLGLNCFRIGLEWSRIEPEKNNWNEEAINGYKNMIIAMREIIRTSRSAKSYNSTNLDIITSY
jgi:beta-glucosidase